MIGETTAVPHTYQLAETFLKVSKQLWRDISDTKNAKYTMCSLVLSTVYDKFFICHALFGLCLVSFCPISPVVGPQGLQGLLCWPKKISEHQTDVIYILYFDCVLAILSPHSG